jgi:hypothetical protein
MTGEDLSARRLAKHGMRRGAYDGATKRRFCLFVAGRANGEAVEWRYEFDTKSERDEYARKLLASKVQPGAVYPLRELHATFH